MNNKTDKFLGYLVGFGSHVLACVANYYAWIVGNTFWQTILWMIVPLSIIGLSIRETGKEMRFKFKSFGFWLFWLLSQPVCLWTWFSSNSDVAHFYGGVSIMITLFSFYIAIKYKENV